jgi:RNA polymerase sigma factor (sigma-70 family)
MTSVSTVFLRLEIERAYAMVLPVHVRADMNEPMPRERTPQRLERLREGLTRWFSRRTGDPVEAQDLVQESMVRVVERERRGELEHLDGYAYRVAANILTDWHRRRTVRHARDHISIDHVAPPANDIDPYRQLVGNRALRAASAALESLPERTRTIFILRRIEGMRHKEIAVRLGISVSTVEKHVVLALEAISIETKGWQ